ncbi:MAG TPA: hypothetical protein VMY76_05935 [Gemmatimonadales bacterium]|nr:hypothetical protein [Gemmatimonadales bacterium]
MVLLLAGGCSPEAKRERDGGRGADPGNKELVVHAAPTPRAADTTLWPGRAAAPVDLLARGVIAPPSFPAPKPASGEQRDGPDAPAVPPSASQQGTFDRGTTADPRQQTSE